MILVSMIMFSPKVSTDDRGLFLAICCIIKNYWIERQIQAAIWLQR